MRGQRLVGAGELALALLCLVLAGWQWSVGVGHSRTPVKLPNGEEQWLTVYNGPQVISAVVFVAAAILLLVDGAVRLRRARKPDRVAGP